MKKKIAIMALALVLVMAFGATAVFAYGTSQANMVHTNRGTYGSAYGAGYPSTTGEKLSKSRCENDSGSSVSASSSIVVSSTYAFVNGSSSGAVGPGGAHNSGLVALTTGTSYRAKVGTVGAGICTATGYAYIY